MPRPISIVIVTVVFVIGAFVFLAREVEAFTGLTSVLVEGQSTVVQKGDRLLVISPLGGDFTVLEVDQRIGESQNRLVSASEFSMRYLSEDLLIETVAGKYSLKHQGWNKNFRSKMLEPNKGLTFSSVVPWYTPWQQQEIVSFSFSSTKDVMVNGDQIISLRSASSHYRGITFSSVTGNDLAVLVVYDTTKWRLE